MNHKISVRIPNEIFQSLAEEAKKYGVRVSDIVRNKILPSKNPRADSHAKIEDSVNVNGLRKVSASASPAAENQIPKLYFVALETLYLLREFLFERNGQILKRVDERMEKRFGKERERVP